MQSLPEDGDLASIHQPLSHSSSFPYFLAWTTLPLFLLSLIVLVSQAALQLLRTQL